MMLPFDASGFAPSISRKSVRSMSEMGNIPGPPRIWLLATIIGSWSTLVAEKRQRVPSARWNGAP